nr:cullin-1 [Quercus suber]
MTDIQTNTPPPVPTRYDNADDVWPYLEWYMNRIMSNAGTNLDTRTYMSIYGVLHDFGGACLSSRGGKGTSDRTQMERLYRYLEQYTKTHVAVVFATISPLINDSLLDVYLAEWTRFRSASRYIDHLFESVNRHWVKRERDEGRKDLREVHDLFLDSWKGAMSDSTRAAIMEITLRLVEQQKLTKSIERSKANGILESFIVLELEEAEQIQRALTG